MLDHFPADQSFVRDPPAAETGLALIAIPSTLSAAETTFGGGVVHGGRKLVFVGESLYISDILLDPEVFATTPDPTLLATGMNALNHATERLLSPRRQPIADAQFLHAVRLLVPGLRQLARAGTKDREALVSCVIGAHLSGSTNVLGGVGHAIAHVLGARYEVGHGVANGIVLPRALRHAAPGHPETIAMIAGTLGVANDADELERVLVELVTGIGLPSRLSEIGVPRSDLPEIVSDTLADFSTAVATPGLTASSVQALLERAY
jgi:maleylacetate reductase